MSTINMMIRGRSAYVLAETAWIDPKTGVLLASQGKVLQLTHIPAVVLVRGPDQLLVHLGVVFGQNPPESFEDIKRFFETDLRRLIESNFREVEADIAACGWSRREGKPMSCFTSTSKIHPNPPYEVIDPGSTIICPSTPETLRGFEYQDAIDPFRDGLTLLHRQRKIVPPPLVPGGPSVVLVGGFAELLNITSESIVSWTLGRWPDKAGEVPVREAKPVPLPRGDGLIWQGRSMAAL